MSQRNMEGPLKDFGGFQRVLCLFSSISALYHSFPSCIAFFESLGARSHWDSGTYL